VRDALALFEARSFRAKSFRPPSEGESLSLEWPRESNSAAAGRRKLFSSECRKQSESIAHKVRSYRFERIEALRATSNIEAIEVERHQWPAGKPNARTAFTSQRNCTPWRVS
jgi:hypothetical protein